MTNADVTLKISIPAARTGEFSPKKSYRRFLRRHRTVHKAGRHARRGLKAGVGALYRRL